MTEKILSKLQDSDFMIITAIATVLTFIIFGRKILFGLLKILWRFFRVIVHGVFFPFILIR